MNKMSKAEYFEDIEFNILEVKELLDSMLYDLRNVVYNDPHLCGFENNIPAEWKDVVIGSLQARAHDANCVLSHLFLDTLNGFNPDNELSSLIQEWDKQTLLDKLSGEEV
jgi:hypothetical protein